LKGAALYVAGVITLALIGAVTFLVADGDLSGSDALIVFTPILTGVVGVTSAHVAGQTAAAAINTPPPVTATMPAPLAQPAGEPSGKVV